MKSRWMASPTGTSGTSTAARVRPSPVNIRRVRASMERASRGTRSTTIRVNRHTTRRRSGQREAGASREGARSAPSGEGESVGREDEVDVADDGTTEACVQLRAHVALYVLQLVHPLGPVDA